VSAVGGLEVGEGVVGDQAGQGRRPAVVGEPDGAVEGVGAGDGEGGAVADVVDPGRGEVGVRVVEGQALEEFGRGGGDTDWPVPCATCCSSSTSSPAGEWGFAL